MSGVLKFVYAIILFLFLFLVAREVGGLGKPLFQKFQDSFFNS